MTPRLLRNFFASPLIVILLSAMAFPRLSHAIKPEWNSGMLLLKAEYTHGRMNTGYAAVAGGVEQWFNWYQYVIEAFCFNNSGYTYWANLPGYGYTQVTAEKLAYTIWNESFLGLTFVPYEVIERIETALQEDHDNNAYEVSSTHQWDPYWDWKWRSVFMEGRYSENGSSTAIMSNCWGNANYLTMAGQWLDGYSTYKSQALGFGFSEWGASFPHIYLDGGEYYPTDQFNDYSIDRDLQQTANYTGFEFAAYGNEVDPRYYINSFDIVRMAEFPIDPENAELWEMEPINSGINVGENVHSAVYLTTDAAGVGWMYQKGNFGSTDSAPYGLHYIGDALGVWQYGDTFSYRSYFRHHGFGKALLANSYDIDWGNVD